MTKRTIKLAVLFSISVFAILLVTMFLTGLITMQLLNAGILHENKDLIFVVFGAVSIIIGTFLSLAFGRKPIKAITAISDATKEVAKGNFDTQINEKVPTAELRAMAHNFNLMIKELSNTEMLRKDFIENVSHEFKTPLTAIEGYTTLLQNKHLTEQKRLEYTEKILYNTKRLSSLTGNILLLSRLENQEIPITKEYFSLDEQIRETILLYEIQWSEKNLELDINLNNVDYCGNKELLAQVWQNILGNAIKFVSDNGLISISLEQTATSVDVTITDNGIGMNDETLHRIYEKFYQGDKSHSTAGNGLGLALAKRIVNLHQGSIYVSSRENKGSSFLVTLPLQPKDN